MTVKVVKIGTKYRVVESSSGKISKKGKSPVDGGGHESRAKAKAQVTAINRKK